MSAQAETAQEQGFAETPRGAAKRWEMELEAADKEVANWLEQGRKIIARFRDERDGPAAEGQTRWNLFTSSTQMRRDMMYGKPPTTSVSRKFSDAEDDVARVAGETLDRALNAGDGDSFRQALRHALCDRLLPGLGIARARYEAVFEDLPGQPAKVKKGQTRAPEVPAQKKKVKEEVETDYIHWQDFRWSAGARVWGEVRWVAFRAQLSRKQLLQKFGDDGQQVPLNTRNADGTSSKGESPWARADVWEVWSKEDGKRYHIVRGFRVVLTPQGLGSGQVDKDGGVLDPYGLPDFFPCPEPMQANATTDTLVPRPDFLIAQDLYNEIDLISNTISLIEDAIKVRWVYDKEAAPELANILNGSGNKGIPATNFGRLAEKGGLKGVIDFLPLEMLVGAVVQLRDYRRELVDAVYQVTGDSDIMRGQATNPDETATAQGLKAQFGSVRMQARKAEFARFASDLQKIRAALMVRFFDPQTFFKRTNILKTPDAKVTDPESGLPLPQAAVAFLKSEGAHFRIEVKPDAIAMSDFAALKQERTDVIQAVAQYFVAIQPLAQAMPGSLPYLLEILQWLVAAIRGGEEIESVLDRAIAAAQQLQSQPQQPQQAPPDPKLLVQQMKGEQDMAKIAAERDADLVRTQADVAAERAKQQAQTEENVKEHLQKTEITRALRPMEAQNPMGVP